MCRGRDSEVGPRRRGDGDNVLISGDECRSEGLAAEFAANDLLDIVEAFATQRNARGLRPGVDQSRISGPRVMDPVRDSLAGVRRSAVAGVAGVGKLFG